MASAGSWYSFSYLLCCLCHIQTLLVISDPATPSHPAETPFPPFSSPDHPRSPAHLFPISFKYIYRSISTLSLQDCLVCIHPSFLGFVCCLPVSAWSAYFLIYEPAQSLISLPDLTAYLVLTLPAF